MTTVRAAAQGMVAWIKQYYPLLILIGLALPPRLLGWTHQLAGDDEAAHILASLRLATTQPWALDPLANTFAQLLQAYHGWVTQLLPFLVYASLRAVGLPIAESTVHLPALLFNLGAIAVWYLWAQRIWGRATAFWGVLMFAWLAGSVRLGRSLHGNENFQLLGQGLACLVLERRVGTDPLATPWQRWALGWPLLLYVGMDNVFFLFGLVYCLWVGMVFTRGPTVSRIARLMADFGWRNPAAWASAALVGLYVIAAVATVALEGELSAHGFLLRTFYNDEVQFGLHLDDLLDVAQTIWGPVFLGAAGLALAAAIGLKHGDRGLAMLALLAAAYLVPMLLGGHAGRLVILGLPLALIVARAIDRLARRFSAWLWLAAAAIALTGLVHSLGLIHGLGPAALDTPRALTVLAPNGLKAAGYLLRAEFQIRETVQAIEPRGIDTGSLQLAMSMDAAGQFYVGARYWGVENLEQVRPSLIVTFESPLPGRYAAPDQTVLGTFVARHRYRCVHAVFDGAELLARLWIPAVAHQSACQQAHQYVDLANAFDQRYYRIADFASPALGGY